MIERVKLIEKHKSTYFKGAQSLVFIPSGCTPLNLVLGGGWPLKRVGNVIGDKSVGKTQLAIEAMINFLRMFEDGYTEYQEVESAFDIDYADSLGPEGWTKKIHILEDVETVEETLKATNHFLKKLEKKGVPGLRIIDTLDGIHDSSGDTLAEGYDKARRAGEINDFVTKCVGRFKRSNAHMMVISQVRENIGVTFGERYRRAGGKALDFYASQCLWLSEIKKVTRTVGKIKKPVAIKVRAKAKKNKVGLPYRECEFPILFGYGIDDATACVEFLKTIDCLGELSDKKASKIIDAVHEGDKKLRGKMRRLVREKWDEIEDQFLPKFKKY